MIIIASLQHRLYGNALGSHFVMLGLNVVLEPTLGCRAYRWSHLVGFRVTESVAIRSAGCTPSGKTHVSNMHKSNGGHFAIVSHPD
jgi:hypothetical protein